jgi:hypothetical protein
MPQENLGLLRRQLVNIAKEEVRASLRTGKTDRETVALRVEDRASTLLTKLAPVMVSAELRNIVAHLLKKTDIRSGEEEEEKATSETYRQMELAEMDEFRGIDPNVTYVDKPGHVAYIPYLKTRQAQRAAALKYLDQGIAADLEKRQAMEAGNDFADTLVELYGDEELLDLYVKWKTADDERASSE